MGISTRAKVDKELATGETTLGNIYRGMLRLEGVYQEKFFKDWLRDGC